MIALIVVVVIIGAGLGYEYATSSSTISHLNQSVSSQQQQLTSQQEQLTSQQQQLTSQQNLISTLNSKVPDSTIMTVHYNLVLAYQGTNYPESEQLSLGLPYHSGDHVTIYLGGNQITNLTGSITYTSIKVDTGGFNVSSLSPALPQTIYNGSTLLLKITLNTPASPYSGDLQVTVDASYSP